MNTIITFYWTHYTNRTFKKTIFNCVLPGSPFESLQDADDWMENNVSEIYNTFDLETVFDHVVINYKKTLEPPTEIQIVKTLTGNLNWKDPSVKKQLPLPKKQTKIEIPTEETKVEETPVVRERKQSLWIDPLGNNFKVAFACHYEFAADWLEENEPNFKEIRRNISFYSPVEYLERKGWVRILGWCDPVSFSLPTKITVKQKKAIKDYCQSNGVDYPEEIKDSI
jgi:hypothetical protein